ncbi:uncharacterized protein LOC117006814 [Catharus ustulatus]|uniref:uncharacterized protein LOC117006814 n=1 Tax=Catharus ustulatus TaxID=91951 RepID=UPI001407C2C1|nr:uncharacterized protein LOC117006814 [Catharus ustulatus]XP_032935339.1 uncharacterized protein LOC117006814 [Catharus ustulatus]XP_032935341.1 uncharacterized protein LOC117006814 [Catharus ustulatus]
MQEKLDQSLAKEVGILECVGGPQNLLGKGEEPQNPRIQFQPQEQTLARILSRAVDRKRKDQEFQRGWDGKFQRGWEGKFQRGWEGKFQRRWEILEGMGNSRGDGMGNSRDGKFQRGWDGKFQRGWKGKFQRGWEITEVGNSRGDGMGNSREDDRENSRGDGMGNSREDDRENSRGDGMGNSKEDGMRNSRGDGKFKALLMESRRVGNSLGILSFLGISGDPGMIPEAPTLEPRQGHHPQIPTKPGQNSRGASQFGMGQHLRDPRRTTAPHCSQEIGKKERTQKFRWGAPEMLQDTGTGNSLPWKREGIKVTIPGWV